MNWHRIRQLAISAAIFMVSVIPLAFGSWLMFAGIPRLAQVGLFSLVVGSFIAVMAALIATLPRRKIGPLIAVLVGVLGLVFVGLPHGLMADFTYPFTWLLGLLSTLVAYGFISDFRHHQEIDGVTDSRDALIEVFDRAPGAPNNLLILAPGIANPAFYVFGDQMLEFFASYGDILRISHPEEGFDWPAIMADMLDPATDAAYDGFILVGQSMGAPMCIELMRKLEVDRVSGFCDWPPVKIFIPDSGFTEASETISPVPYFLSWLFRDLPFARLYWGRITRATTKPSTRLVPEEHVSADLIAAHNAYQRDFSYYGLAAMARFIWTLKRLQAREFLNVPILILEVRGDEYVHENQAGGSFGSAFLVIKTVVLEGVHANLVERPNEHIAAMKPTLDALVLSNNVLVSR